MNRQILTGAGMMAIALLLGSCDDKAKLAEAVQGEWTGNPEKILDTGAADASMVRVLEFTPGSSATEGNVTMTAMITVENTMPFNDSIVTPLQISASGTATITGVYQAKDDDELLISLDVTSMSVSVDPEAVSLNYNVLSQNSAASVDQLKPGAAVLATQQINRAAQNAFSNITQIDDIRIRGNVMSCEINKRDLVFSKVSGVSVLPGKTE